MYNITDIASKEQSDEYILDYFQSIICIKDSNGKYLACNKEFLNFFGLEKQSEVLGKKTEELPISGKSLFINQSLIETIKNEDNYVLKNKKVLNIERFISDKSGQPHWYKIYKVPIFQREAPYDIKGFIAIIENIDKEKRFENQKDLFVATLVHDLKNPIIAFIKSLKLFQKEIDNKISNEQKEMLNLMLESSEYMKDLVYSILKVYRENQGIIKLNKEFFDIEQLIKNCNFEVYALAKRKNVIINFSSKLKQADKLFYADKIHIKRVLYNLLSNAINYAFENTEINIELKKISNKIIYLIQNTSPIIDEKMQSCIFEKYSCGNKIESTGLGLYFCKKVAEAHEGCIYLKSEETENTFILELPILDENYVSLKEIVF